MKKSAQDGFGLIEVLLVLVVLSLTSWLGYYLWHIRYQTASPTTKPLVTQTTNSPVPMGWKTYKSTHSSIKFSYPPDWQIELNSLANQPSWHLEDAILTGPNNFTMTFTLVAKHTPPPQNFMCVMPAKQIDVPINNQYVMVLDGTRDVFIKTTNPKDIINTYCGRSLNAASSNTEFDFYGGYGNSDDVQTTDTFLAKPEIQIAKIIYASLKQ